MVLKKSLTNVFPLLVAVLSVLHLSCGRQSEPPKQDNTPPAVTSFIPGNTETNVQINKSISVTFSEPVDEKTIAFSLVAMKTGGSALVPWTMSYNGTTATFTPDHALEYGTTYNAKVGSGVRDLSGNAMTSETVWSFLTGQNPDTTPPRVVDIQPSRGKKGVSTNSAISIMFSEPMEPATISSQTIKISNVNGDVGGDVSYNGATAAATFTPIFGLSHNTDYTVTVTNVQDLAKNAMTDAFTSSFKTCTSGADDVTPPFITSVFPLNNALNVDVNAPISVVFSEPMNAATITPVHFIVSEGTTSVTVFGDLKYVGTTALFTPSTSLKYSTTYTVTIPMAVTDLAGNGMSADYISSFTTDTSSPDTVRPFVLFTYPSNNQNTVPVFNQVLALFSEKMLASSITPTTFVLYNPNGTPVPGYVTVSGASAFLTPALPLAFLTTYTAVINSGVTDIAGNPLNSNGHTWSFKTAALATFTITATAGAGGSISPADAVSVDQGKNQSFMITPDTGYHIADVQVDGSSVVPTPTTYTFPTVTSDHTINANFAINTYTVTAQRANAFGTLDVTTPSPATVDYGKTASFKFNADPSYHIESVTDNCGGTPYNNTSHTVTTYTYTTPPITAAWCTVTASFARNIYTVAATSNSYGSISPDSRLVSHGDITTFTVTSTYVGYGPDMSGTCGGNLNPAADTYTTNPITADCTVVADFVVKMYTVTTSPGLHGTISPASQQVSHGFTTTFTVTPDSGYTIASVTGCGGTLNGSTYTTGPITAPCAVTATFQ